MDSSATISKRLSLLSEQNARDPYSTIRDWPATLDRDQWFFSSDLISIQGLPAFQALSKSEQQKLSFLECVNFFSLIFNGERYLIAGLSEREPLKQFADLAPYMRHMIDEENKHRIYFGEFCKRYAGKVYPDKKMAVSQEYPPGAEDFLFFARAVVFEEIVDTLNVALSNDSRLCPLVRSINQIHHEEEGRHLAFGRTLLRELFEKYRANWEDGTLSMIRDQLGAWYSTTWKEFCNPAVYRDAGISKPYELYTEALANPAAARRRREFSSRCIEFLVESSILLQEPVA